MKFNSIFIVLAMLAAPAGGEEVDDLSPLPTVRWSVPAPNDPAEQRIVDEARKSLTQSAMAPIPMNVPVVVKVPAPDEPKKLRSVVVARSEKRVFLIDAETGIRIAFHPAHSDLALPAERAVAAIAARRTAIHSRTWHGESVSSLAVDSQRLLFIEQATGPLTDQPNRLTSLDIAREGAIHWSVGGDDGGDEPKLKKAAFLGMPLITGNSLHAVVRHEGHVSLVQLNKKTGALRRVIQCLDVKDARVPIFYWHHSHTPIATGNQLLVPLPGGEVMAFEAMADEPKWHYERDPLADRWVGGEGFFAERHLRRDNREPAFAQPLVTDEAMIVPLPLASKLVCLNLNNGKVRWETKCGPGYIACIEDGAVIAVSASSVTGFDLETGKQSWDTKLPERELPSGRGLLHRGHYHLPTTGARLHKIDLRTGEIVRTIATGHSLGNLVRDGGKLISYDGARVESFYIAEALARQVDTRLKDNPEDAWALARKGELLLAAGDAAGALRWLRRSLEQEETDETRRSIVNVTLRLLKDNAVAHLDSGQAALLLARQPAERIELLQHMITGYADNDQPGRALSVCLLLLSELDQHPELARTIIVEPEANRRVRIDRWLRGRMHPLQREADLAE